MNILIIGCGKVGSRLAGFLSRRGHAVSIVDRSPWAFDRLDDDFTGYTVEGIPLDGDVLKEAGIEGCDILVAVTNDDNINLMVGQMAREIFGVPKVLARLYDPRRRDVYSQMGLHVVCPTSITTDNILSIIEENIEEGTQVSVAGASLGLSVWKVPDQYVGQPVSSLPKETGYAVLGIVDERGKIFRLGAEAEKVVLAPGDRILRGRALG